MIGIQFKLFSSSFMFIYSIVILFSLLLSNVQGYAPISTTKKATGTVIIQCRDEKDCSSGGKINYFSI